MAWAKIASDTLTSAGDTAETGVQTSFNFNFLLSHTFATGGDMYPRGRAGNTTLDTGNNYARRFSNNGVEGTGVNVPYYGDFAGTSSVLTADQFAIAYLCNISGEEKLIIIQGISQSTAGAANAPTRQESSGKWATATGQADNIGVENSQAGDFAIDSNFTALGTD